MNKLTKILWGVVLVVVGVIFALNSFNITNINVFFDGWWTLFIIVPCLISLFSQYDKTASIVGLCIGVFLLLCCQNIIDFDILWKLAIPVIIVIIGVKLIFGGVFGRKSDKVMNTAKSDGAYIRNVTATFSGQNINCDGEFFQGAELNAIFGGVKCDLRNAIIDKDCAINATAIFGGVDIFLPDNVNVKVNSNSIFGGVSNKKGNNTKENSPTVYINGTCLFGGVDIK